MQISFSLHFPRKDSSTVQEDDLSTVLTAQKCVYLSQQVSDFIIW